MTPLVSEIQALRNDLPLWAEKYAKIRPAVGGKVIPFRFNRAQRVTHQFLEDQRLAGHPVRAAIVKGRKQGVSTYITARNLHRATLNRGISVFILAHISKSTSYLFDMVKRMHQNLPDHLRPSAERSNKIELKFGAIDSEYALGSAESEEIGRGMTPLLLHCSEAAKYRNTDEIQTGLIQGVPACPGSEIVYESTANGVNNMFYNLCMRGIETQDEGRLKTLFLPWYWQLEYRAIVPAGFNPSADESALMDQYGLDLQQIYWRRRKLEDDFSNDIWKFRQEYPMDLMDAFVTSGEMMIKPEYVDFARKNCDMDPDPLTPIILGVDGADSGDRTALVLRQGKKILAYWVYTEMKPMRLAGIIAGLIDKFEIDMVFLDIAYGYGCRDRLRELGYGQKTQTVHFGEAALEPEVYRNKRAQMYGYLKEWFEEGGSSIPNDNLFCRDILMMPKMEQSGSRGLLILPSKLTIRKDNGGISPDIADAAALTFAYPVLRRQAAARVMVASLNSKQVSVFKTKRRMMSIGRTEKPSELFVKRSGD